MDQFEILEQDGRLITVLVKNMNFNRINLLRHAMLGYIPTYAVEYVTFYENSSDRENEALATRFGSIPIDQSTPDLEDDLTIRVDFRNLNESQEPLSITTGDIPELQFSSDDILITELTYGQSVICDLTIKLGYGKDHVKWRPVSSVAIQNQGNGEFILKFKTLNMLPAADIMILAFNHLDDVIEDVAPTKFSKVVE